MAIKIVAGRQEEDSVVLFVKLFIVLKLGSRLRREITNIYIVVMAILSNGDWPADMLTEILSSFVSQHLSLSKNNNYLLVDYFDGNKDDKRVMHLLAYQTLVSYDHDLSQHLPDHLLTNRHITFCVDNGLFCLLNQSNYQITLWNTATRESRILPECNQNFPPKLEYCLHILGFGFDPLSNDYKVIYIRTFSDGETKRRGRHNAIYRMSMDSWRVLEDEEDVHFFKDVHICPNHNITFFELMPSPISACGKLIPLHDGRISMWDTERIQRSERRNEVWVLNDGGHWSKLLKIDPLSKVEKMLGFWKNGKVFVLSKTGQLLLYDLDTKEYTDLGIKANEGYIIDVYT
ncbi:hypothetical protein PTKIN_Ptkin13bG0192300 [Pterospermum kingtungense]